LVGGLGANVAQSDFGRHGPKLGLKLVIGFLVTENDQTNQKPDQIESKIQARALIAALIIAVAFSEKNVICIDKKKLLELLGSVSVKGKKEKNTLTYNYINPYDTPAYRDANNCYGSCTNDMVACQQRCRNAYKCLTDCSWSFSDCTKKCPKWW